jgi:hypothetical protein
MIMACSCNSGTSTTYKVQAPNGAITTWRTEAEANAAAERTGGTRLN